MTLLYIYIATIVLGPPLILGLLWLAHLWFWGWRLRERPEYALFERIALPDGGVVELRRVVEPSHEGLSDTVPVLLVHGLAMSHLNHDSVKEASFARYLAERGRDVWLVTLRSGRRRLSLFGPRNATFEAMVEHDLPTAVATVLARTAQPQLDLGVFSMGGMLVYAALDRTLDPTLLRRTVVLASPARVRPLGLLAWSRFLPRSLTLTVPIRFWMQTLAFAPRWVSRVLWRHLYNASNVDRQVERRMLFNIWQDIPGQLGADFTRWSGRGGHLTLKGQRVLEGLAHVSVPVCFFAGVADQLAPVGTVLAGYEAWGSALKTVDKHFVVLGKAHGTRHDYGHCDVAVGRHVHEEVFAPAAHFLATGVLVRRGYDERGSMRPIADPSAA